MRKTYKKLAKDLPLEACSADLVAEVLEKSGIKERAPQQAQMRLCGKDQWAYRLATLLIIAVLTGTAVFDLIKRGPVDPSLWSVNSHSLVDQFIQKTEILLGEGCVKK